MRGIFLLGFLFASQLGWASEPCDPSKDYGNYLCKEYKVETSTQGEWMKAPPVYFWARKGPQKGWVQAQGCRGGWALRLMKWMKLPGDPHNRFHEVSRAGEEIFYIGQEAFYRYEAMCSSDTQLPLSVIALIP